MIIQKINNMVHTTLEKFLFESSLNERRDKVEKESYFDTLSKLKNDMIAKEAEESAAEVNGFGNGGNIALKTRNGVERKYNTDMVHRSMLDEDPAMYNHDTSRQYYINTYAARLKSLGNKRDVIANEYLSKEAENLNNFDEKRELINIDNSIINLIRNISIDRKINNKRYYNEDLPTTVKTGRLDLYDDAFREFGINVNNILRVI